MVEKFKLSNGLTVVYQRLAGYKSVSIGVWVKTGSARETTDNNGISHFIEHMVFKGTQNRTASDIARAIDGVGGEINAYTAKECTCFYTKTLKDDLVLSLDLLSDMVINPLFDTAHIETEKTVIIDEINMYEDASEELADDLMHEILFKDHALSLPVLGTKENISGFTRDMILSYYSRYYVAENMVLSIAGEFNPDELIQHIEHYFGSLKSGKDFLLTSKSIPEHHWDYKFKNKDFEQLQIVMSFPGIPFDDPLSYEMTLLNNILGGSNSSMLFQEVREKLGLTYSIYSEPTFYDDIGILEISFGVSKEKAKDALKAICKVICIIKGKTFTREDVAHGKSHLKGSFVLGLEGTDQYMDLIGRIELFAHKEKTMEDMIEKIEKASLDGVFTLIDHVFGQNNLSMAFVGEINEKEAADLYGYVKKCMN